MHNIDRTMLETGYEGEYGANEYEYGHEYEGEFGYEGEGEFYGEVGKPSPFSEAHEMALAAELLSVSNEQELEQFIGKLFKGASKFLKSSVGKQLGGIIKGVAKNALPMLGSVAGNMLLPGIGGMIGGKLAGAAGSMLGLELEGLSNEDKEYEIARQIVRFGGAAASNAEEISTAVPPQQAAQTAAAAAARQYAPGILNTASSAGMSPYQGQQGRCNCTHKQSGRWVRSGGKIFILGA